MVATVRTMIDAGALRHLCMWHARNRKDNTDWSKTREYAAREFRDVDPATIDALIDSCKAAYDMAWLYMRNKADDPDFIPQ